MIYNKVCTYDFTDLFNNINLNDLNHNINSLFQKYYSKLKLPSNVDYDYFQTLINFTINNNFTMHEDIFTHVKYCKGWLFF